MPSELRHIIFRPAEVVQAVKEYQRRMGTPLPTGTVLQCAAEGEEGKAGEVKFRITLLPDRPEPGTVTAPGERPRRDLLIDGPALAAALILSCRDRRIPMPASADKSLQRFGAQICLVASLNPKQDDMPRPDQIRL